MEILTEGFGRWEDCYGRVALLTISPSVSLSPPPSPSVCLYVPLYAPRSLRLPRLFIFSLGFFENVRCRIFRLARWPLSLSLTVLCFYRFFVFRLIRLPTPFSLSKTFATALFSSVLFIALLMCASFYIDIETVDLSFGHVILFLVKGYCVMPINHLFVSPSFHSTGTSAEVRRKAVTESNCCAQQRSPRRVDH